MQRPIIGFGLDEENDWFAWLDCGHTLHVRHRPPFIERPWVTTRAGRQSWLGRPLDCVLCDRFEWPEAVVFHKSTRVFDQITMPERLRCDHATRAGVWAWIDVFEGRLRYIVPSCDVDRLLVPGKPGVVVPELAHRVEPQGPVRFRLALYRLPRRNRDDGSSGSRSRGR